MNERTIHADYYHWLIGQADRLAEALHLLRDGYPAERVIEVLTDSADPVIHAQHDETGRMWTGPRSQLPRRYFECVTDEDYAAQVAASTVPVGEVTK
jgi:hypothetical protein